MPEKIKNPELRPKILVADDDPAIVEVLQMMLEDAGYSVCTTVDGQTLAKVQDDLPDMLLLDIWMSGVDGREICRQIKQRPDTRHIPVIMISANRDCASMAKEAGADDFLVKPFEMDDLLAKVGQHF